MVQDTVKYVENQVQNVGESVKKFYSDVVEDLLPSSSVDHVKALASDLSVDRRYSDVGIHKTPEVPVKKVPVIVNVDRLTENSKVIADRDKYFGNALSHRKNKLSPSSVDSVKGTCDSGQYNNGSISNNSKMGVKNGLGNEKFSATEISEAIRNDLSRASSFLELLNENHGAPCDNTAKISAPALAEVRGVDSILESSNALGNASDHTSDVPIASASSDLSVLASFVRNEGTEKRFPRNDGLSVESNGEYFLGHFFAIALLHLCWLPSFHFYFSSHRHLSI